MTRSNKFRLYFRNPYFMLYLIYLTLQKSFKWLFVVKLKSVVGVVIHKYVFPWSALTQWKYACSWILYKRLHPIQPHILQVRPSRHTYSMVPYLILNIHAAIEMIQKLVQHFLMDDEGKVQHIFSFMSSMFNYATSIHCLHALPQLFDENIIMTKVKTVFP